MAITGKAFTNLLGMICLATFMALIAVRPYYSRTMPRSPQPDVGRVIAVEGDHCITLYITPNEKNIYDASYIVGGFIIAITGLLYMWRGSKEQVAGER